VTGAIPAMTGRTITMTTATAATSLPKETPRSAGDAAEV
jgi:hypothetical protein